MNTQFLEKLMANCAFPEEAQSELLKAFEKLGQNDYANDFAAILKLYPECAYNDDEVKPKIEALSNKSSIAFEQIWMLVLIHTAEAAQDLFASLGVSEEIYWDTFSDLRCKLLECKELSDVWGTAVQGWYHHFFKGHLFKLGRMEYEFSQFGLDEPHTFGEYTINPGDFALGLHIPSSGEPFDLSARIDSYKKAYDFFCAKDKKPLVCLCTSWLLYPPYKDALPQNSNIADFMNDFQMFEQIDTDDFHDIGRVFGRDCRKPTEELPEKTSLQRSMKKYLLSGGNVGEGFGVLIFDGEKIVTRK